MNAHVGEDECLPGRSISGELRSFGRAIVFKLIELVVEKGKFENSK